VEDITAKAGIIAPVWDKGADLYSITSSALASSNGTVRPSALAVLRIDHEIELVRLLALKIGRIGTFQDVINVRCGSPEERAR
jgi:hypothetical protein